MEDGNLGLIIGLFIGLLLGVVIAGTTSEIYYKNEIEELGKSICEEEYGMDYESYIGEVLKCKPFKETYDGIRVEVPKGTNEKLRNKQWEVE